MYVFRAPRNKNMEVEVFSGRVIELLGSMKVFKVKYTVSVRCVGPWQRKSLVSTLPD